MIVPPLIILGSMGLIFGLGLYIASRVFRVHVDVRVEHIEKILPGANCGACGLAGCAGLARAIVHGSADVASCIPGGEEIAHLIANVMGVEAKGMEKKVAILRCQGRELGDRFIYDGIKTCSSANLLHGGPKACIYGCIGFGDCVFSCPFDAIRMVDGLPKIDEVKCTGCGKCVEACPKGLFDLKPLSKLVHVRCMSLDPGRDVRKICKVGCIACKKCETVCEFDAVRVENNLAIFDYEKCTSCGACVEACPTGTIMDYRKERKAKMASG